MFKKFTSWIAIPVFMASSLSIVVAPNADATSPTLTWTPSSLSSTNSLVNLNMSLISGDGTTKLQIESTSSTSAYVSRNGGSWNLATGLSTVNMLTGAAIDQTGEHILITGMANGGMGAPKVAVSNDYGATFTVSTPYPDSGSRGTLKTAVSPDGRTMIIGSYYNTNVEILTSNDFGSTWSYKTLGSGYVRIAAASASYLGTGKNIVYAMTTSGLTQHVFSSSDSSAISGNMDAVVGVGSSDTTALASMNIQGLAVSNDGTHAFVAASNYAATIKNVTIDSTGKWAFSGAVTPTYTPSAPSVLNGSNYGEISSLAVSNDGSTIAFTFVSSMTSSPYTSLGHIFTSQDSGATFATPYSNLPSYNLGISMSSNGSKQYTTVSNAAKYSSNSGVSFTTDTAQVVSSAAITEIAGSDDGSVMFLQSGGFSAPPTMLLTRDYGSTATSFDSIGGASTTYSTKAYVSSNGTKAIFANINYSNQTWSLKEFYGTNFGSTRTLNLPSGVTKLQSAAFSRDLSTVLIADRTTGTTGQLFYGTISDGVVTWSSGLGDTTTYSGLAVTPAGFYAISILQSKLYSASITNGVAGSVTTNTSPFANGFTGTWSSISASSNGRYLAVSNYGSLSSNCYAGGYVYKSSDFGATWSVIPSGASSTTVGPVSISADGSILAFGTASGGYLKVSTDGGSTFADQTSLGSFTCSGQMGAKNRWYSPFIYVPSGSDFGIAVSSSSAVFNSTTYSATPSLTAQTISFTTPSAMTVGDANQALTVSASSGLAVALSTANSAICTIVSSRVHAVGAGTCSITAAQAGDSTYSAASNVTKTFTISAASSSQSAEELAQQLAAAIEAERLRQVAIAAARVVLQGVLTSSKPGTLAQFREADFTITSDAVLNRVNAALMKLPADRRVKIEEINNAIKVESFIVQISSPITQKSITQQQLVNIGLISSANSYKVTLTNALKKRPATSLDSLEKIAAAISEEMAVIKARSARLAAIKAKIAARNK